MNWKYYFTYQDGKLYWNVSTGRRVKIGDEAGTITSSGHRQVSINKTRYLAHRIIWEMHNGSICDGLEIDHIDHNQDNNKIENLRLVTRRENCKNLSMMKNNTSGFNGVSFIRSIGKWRASIKIEGKSKTIGVFSSIDEAIRARESSNIMFLFHENHGKQKPL